LVKSEKPDLAYKIDDASKSYTEIDLKKMREMGNQPGAPERTYTVKKLGKEKVLGFECQHVLVTEAGAHGGEIEMWTSKEVMDYATFSKLQPRQGSRAAMEKALKDA